MATSGHVSQSELTEKMKKVLDILTGNAPNTQSSLKSTSVSSSAPSTPQSVMTSDDKYTISLPISIYIYNLYRASLLADLCQLAMEHHCINIAAQCITNIPYDVQVWWSCDGHVRSVLPQGSVLLLRIEFLRCQLMVKSTEKDNQVEIYSKSAVEVT